MTIPTLKRIKLSSEAELRSWLAKQTDQVQGVMLITCGKKSPDKYISSAIVRDAVADHGWTSGRSYTLNGNLVGHVVSPG